jgi:hypothetical protein
MSTANVSCATTGSGGTIGSQPGSAPQYGDAPHALHSATLHCCPKNDRTARRSVTPFTCAPFTHRRLRGCPHGGLTTASYAGASSLVKRSRSVAWVCVAAGWRWPIAHPVVVDVSGRDAGDAPVGGQGQEQVVRGDHL